MKYGFHCIDGVNHSMQLAVAIRGLFTYYVKIWGDYNQKNPDSGRAMVKGKMLHFVAFFVHFDKLIRPHPGPLWGGVYPPNP